jgi:hypothetical protein
MILGALLMTSRSMAADFRALDFRAPCETAPALEAALGSTPLEGRLPSGFQYAFNTREMDRDAIVGYACREGRLFRGAYIFPVKDAQEATAVYKGLKQRLTSERGKPSYDFASAEYKQKMKAVGATLSLSDTQVAFWDGKTSEAHASVAAPSATRGWQVSVSYTVNE